MLFLSTFTNKIDKKGRVSVPSQYRNVLRTEQFNGIVAYSSFINECVEACGMSRVEKLSETIDQLDPYSEERDAFATTILGGSFQLPLDADGRIILPAEMIEVAKLQDRALFIGKGATFEIWEPENFKEYFSKAKEVAKSERAKLKFNREI